MAERPSGQPRLTRPPCSRGFKHPQTHIVALGVNDLDDALEMHHWHQMGSVASLADQKTEAWKGPVIWTRLQKVWAEPGPPIFVQCSFINAFTSLNQTNTLTNTDKFKVEMNAPGGDGDRALIRSARQTSLRRRLVTGAGRASGEPGVLRAAAGRVSQERDGKCKSPEAGMKLERTSGEFAAGGLQGPRLVEEKGGSGVGGATDSR